MSRRRVVVTGLGMLTPLGSSVKTSWDGVLAGRSGIGMIEHFDAVSYSTRICGVVEGFDVTDYMAAKDARKIDIFMQYGIAAAAQAIEDSGIEINPSNARRAGVVMGSGIGGLSMIEDNVKTLASSGARRISPFFVPGAIINMISGRLSIIYGFKGPNYAVSTACTTGTHCIGMAGRNIAYGEADIMIAGGAEKASCEIGMAGFAAARALSTRNDDPAAASRPWDSDRDGFVLGDGAGALVLEEYEHARKRGAHIYAELSGFGMSGDAFHMTAPPESGEGAASSMLNAIEDASLSPSQVDYINAHGTSTPAGDIAESQAVESVMGDHAKNIAVSSTKSMIGHLLGAAGAVESIFSILSIRDQIAPPTINLDNPGEGCRLDYVPHKARKMKIDHALSNSFGFGGTNGSLLFSRIEP
ncbi:beta-ketoacyl-ACP synthase II [Aestuariirhabdus sp. LZHN29]|uniref:beta-ketoacyl-ACP synthase II n=1 Tax=Aestuariirhabdus sp. LZHN29 TaxID=3417462 RepID=UPI003CF20A4D